MGAKPAFHELCNALGTCARRFESTHDLGGRSGSTGDTESKRLGRSTRVCSRRMFRDSKRSHRIENAGKLKKELYER
ncbi:hypothetical protein ACU8KH_05665 [Lachancea thermotolerans]